MKTETEPNDDALDTDLADLNEAMDFVDVDLADDDAEDPDETLQEHSEQEDETGGDSETEEEEENSESEEEEEQEETEQEEPSKAVQELQKRVDTLTYRSKTAEERVAELENELAEAQASSSEPSTKTTTFKNPREIDERDSFLQKTIRGLGDMVAGEPARINDPATGEMVDNTIEIEGKAYPVRHVRQRLHELEDERAELPRAREVLKSRVESNAQARKLMPSAWQAGTPANAERLALIKDYPELRGASEKVIVEAVVGRLALKQRETARRAAGKSSKLGQPLKSTSRVPARGTTNKSGVSKQAVMDSMDVPDTEMADLAVALMDA